MGNSENEEFSENKITTEAVSWIKTDVTVRYDGQYAGTVKLQEDGKYQCAVSLLKKGVRILQAFGVSDSIENGAKAVGHQFWLSNIYTKPSE